MPASHKFLTAAETKITNRIAVLICLALVVVTVIAFSPVRVCDFINLDDDVYVSKNPYVQSGLGWNSIKQAFSYELVKRSANWHPLTWLSLMLDCRFFGLNPTGYHLENLLFHVINTILIFLVLRRMTKRLWHSAFVAALFAIHPLHVESVAWIAERKDVLSAFFWMLTMGAYSYYVESPGRRRYLAVLLFFVLGLMAKPMLVTLPFVLLLLDYWPLQRLQPIAPDPKIQPGKTKTVTPDKRNKEAGRDHAEKKRMGARGPVDSMSKWSLIQPLIREKMPLFVLALLSSIVTYVAQEAGGGIPHSMDISPGVRIGNAFASYIAYMFKMIWPSRLAVLYPHPEKIVIWQVSGSAVLLVVITWLVFKAAKKRPYLATGWLWYLGTLIPVIGLVQVGAQSMADRYTYIPLIGLFVIVAWGIPDLLKKWNWTYRKEALLGLSILCLLSLSIITWKQVGYWKDSITLFTHALKVTKNNWLTHNNRGGAYVDLGMYREAIEDYGRVVEIRPAYPEGYCNRGNVYNILKNYQLAIEDENKAILIDPNFFAAYYNRAIAYTGLGNFQQGIEDYGRAIGINPNHATAYNNRGIIYYNLGNYEQSIIDYTRAIEIRPDYPEPYSNRGNAYIALKNYQQAIENLNKVIEINPNYAEACNSRGVAYASLGNYGRAIDDFSRAVKIKPDYINAYVNRSAAYERIGNNNLAINDLKAAAKLGSESARNTLKQSGAGW